MKFEFNIFHYRFTENNKCTVCFAISCSTRHGLSYILQGGRSSEIWMKLMICI